MPQAPLLRLTDRGFQPDSRIHKTYRAFQFAPVQPRSAASFWPILTAAGTSSDTCKTVTRLTVGTTGLRGATSTQGLSLSLFGRLVLSFLADTSRLHCCSFESSSTGFSAALTVGCHGKSTYASVDKTSNWVA